MSSKGTTVTESFAIPYTLLPIPWQYRLTARAESKEITPCVTAMQDLN
jgi:hypothetical protein